MTEKRIRIILDSKSAEKNAKDLDKAVVGVGKSADRTGFSMNKLAAAIAAVISVQKIKEYSDAWSSVQNQLRQTVSTSEQLAAVSQRIVNIAIDSRASLEATSQLYTRFRLSVDETTLSNERLFGIVETINKSLALSGATASESAGALRQLSQAIASGVLRGEEFNSIAEQAPGIFRAIQKETGLTAGELRKFAQEGGITTDILIRSLEAYRSTVDTEFGKSKATISQSFEVARTNITQFIGTLDEASGASTSFANLIIDVSKTINDPAVISGLIEFFYLAKETIKSTTEALSQFQDEFTFAGDTASEATSFIGDAFKNILPNIKAFVEVITVEVISVIDKLRVSAVALYEVLSNPFDEEATKKAMQTYNDEIFAISDARQRTLQDIFDERSAIISTAKAAAEARRKEIEERRKLREVESGSVPKFTGGLISGPTGGKKPKESSAQTEIDSARSVTESLRLELETRLQISSAYRDVQGRLDKESYDYKRELLEASLLEQQVLVEQRATEDRQKRNEQLRQALDDDKLTAEERWVLQQYYDEQQKVATELKEEELTAIREKGKLAREELDRAEYQARLANAGALGNALINLGQGQSKKIFKVGQTLALAQAAVALPSAVLESFKNGGGYPWGLIPAAAMLATGVKQIQQIKSAGAGLGGGGGGSVPTPSLGGGSESSINTNAGLQQEQIQQRRIYDFRNVKASDKIPVSALAELLEDDGAVVVLESARDDAARRGVIGVTAR